MVPFQPQPAAGELPARMPSPFDPGPPHPLARRAAEDLRARLNGPLAPLLREAERGKMFGVLVVADGAGRVGYLAGFSGMLGGRWRVDGFVGPLFDLPAREATWPAVEVELDAYDARLRALAAEQAQARAVLAELDGAQAAARQERRARNQARRAERQARRLELAPPALSEAERVSALAALAQESRTDAAGDRWQREAQRAEREPVAARVRALEEARLALERERTARSCALLEGLFAGYQIPAASGRTRALRELFAPATPPGGAGDCAAPKLLGQALRAGLRPLALAEFWWGPPPATGGRHDGHYYPACRGKCGPVLAHMLEGLPVEAPPLFGAGAAPDPEIVFEDPWLLVVDKPVGLLSVPGRSGLLRDSVLARLQDRLSGDALMVHRLDLDTSGLMVVARDPAIHHDLQRQFCRREIDKRYVALLDGAVPGDGGAITLPLRVDLDDRPRQIHDPIHGKPALTEWRVLARAAGRTRVALHPRTGRTHQLRVHAAHPQGIGAPIVGDRLYGRPAERLMLHAEALAFIHPHTGRRVELLRPAPF